MGSDIHMITQVRENGEWRTKHDAFNYRTRNYSVFGMLADVRNGRGFAGAVYGTGFIPISEPKGLPDDLREKMYKILDEYDEEWAEDQGLSFAGIGAREVRDNYVEGEWLGDHSFTWLDMAEIKAYIQKIKDENLQTAYKRYVKESNMREYLRAKNRGENLSAFYEEWISFKAKEVQFEDYIKDPLKYDEDNLIVVYVLVSYLDACASFFGSEAFKSMMGLADQYGDENVRIVFGFDS